MGKPEDHYQTVIMLRQKGTARTASRKVLARNSQ